MSRKVRVLQPYSRFLTCRVGKQEEGLEITDFLMRRFPFRTLMAWEDRLAAGLVTQGSRTLKPGDRLLSEPPLKFANPAQLEPSVPDETIILEKTGDYLLVYKPAPLPVHPGGRYNRNTLIAILREWGLADTQPLLVLHRLDSVTSGLVLLSRNPAFSRTVQGALASGEAEKTYLALVRGVPADDRMTVDSPIRRKHGYVFECHKGGKESRTDFELLRRLDGCSLVRCRPRTGRTHQIRLHLREWGHPVVDDPVYGQVDDPVDGQVDGPVYNQVDDPVDGQVDCGVRGASSQPAHAVLQNRAISLLHIRLQIPQKGLDFRLSDHVVEPIEPEPEDRRPKTGIPLPTALAGTDHRFLLD